MNELKITKGEVAIDGFSINCVITKEKPHETLVRCYPINEPNFEQAKANAELYVDAHNTANACNLLPSELLKKVETLRKCIGEISDAQTDAWQSGEFDAALFGREVSAILSEGYGLDLLLNK